MPLIMASDKGVASDEVNIGDDDGDALDKKDCRCLAGLMAIGRGNDDLLVGVPGAGGMRDGLVCGTECEIMEMDESGNDCAIPESVMSASLCDCDNDCGMNW